MLEEARIQISSALTHLFGAGGLRALAAVANGRLQCPAQELEESLAGTVSDIQHPFLQQNLDRMQLLARQMEELPQWTAEILLGAVTFFCVSCSGLD